MNKIKLEIGYYWIKTITLYSGTGKKIFEKSDGLGIGYYNSDNTWSLIGSDEIFGTFTDEDEINHRETQVIVESSIIMR